MNIQNDQSLISNIFGFMRFPIIIKNKYSIKDNFDSIILGIPCEITSTGKPGSKLAPTNIRTSSIHLTWEKYKWPWKFSLKKYLNVIDGGDLIYKTGNIKNLNKIIKYKINNLLKLNKNIIIMGGDHYITLPILKEYKKKYKNLALIHFDAHTDTYDNNNKFDHGSVFYQLFKNKIIKKKNTIHIGIRTYINNKKTQIISSDDVNNNSINKIIDKIEKIIQKKPTYISFDIDCIDPSYAPGTGTPVIGGITTNKILQIIRKFKNINIIGSDIVEVSPIYDNSDITSLTAATIISELLHLQAYKKYQIKNEKKTKLNI